MNSALFSCDLAVLFVGVPVTFSLWLVFGYIFMRAQIKRFALINANLAKVNKTWSFDHDTVLDAAEYVPSASYTTYLILGIVSCIFSWMGLFFSCFAWLSIWFVKSRKEKFILSTPLESSEVASLELISEVLKEFESRFSCS